MTHISAIFYKLKAHPVLYFLLFLIIVGVSAGKIYASQNVGFIGDEPDDLTNLSIDATQYMNFFKDINSADQSRLTYVITAPIVSIYKTDALQAARFVSIIAFAAFLIVFYKLLRLHLSREQSMFGLLCVATCGYLFSFSYLAMTSSSSIYILFSTLGLYLYLYQRKKQIISNSKSVVLLGIVFGLAMSAKLFGVILIAIVALYDIVSARQWKNQINLGQLRALIRSRQCMSVASFYIFWLLINTLSLEPQLKFGVLVTGLIVLLLIFAYYVTEEKLQIQGIVRWVYATAVAGMVLIVSSPIYLNIKNVFAIFKWTSEWNGVNIIIKPLLIDPFITVAFKLGVVALVLLVIGIVFLIYTGKFRVMIHNYGLLFVVFAVFLVIFTFVHNYFAWYPLVVFWILYLPFCYMFPNRPTKNVTTFIVAATLLLIPAYEVYRYVKIFPYTHTEGAQYGADFVGWNKPGFVTFEALMPFKDYVNETYKTNSITAGCLLIPGYLERYQAYTNAVINSYFLRYGNAKFSCNLETRNVIAKSDYLLTSNYTSQQDLDEIKSKFTEQHSIYINTVKAATLWKKSSLKAYIK